MKSPRWVSLRGSCRAGAAALLALSAASCLGGQTGTEEPVGRPATGEGADCGGPPVTSDDAEAGLSPNAAIELVNALPPLVLDWTSGGSTDGVLRVAPVATACNDLAGGGVRVPVLVVFQSGDGRLDTQIEGKLTIRRATAAGPPMIDLVASRTCQLGPPSAWAVACGVNGVDLTSYQGARVELNARIQPSGTGASALGTIGVSGAMGAPCPSDLPPGSSCSAPAYQTIETGTFASP